MAEQGLPGELGGSESPADGGVQLSAGASLQLTDLKVLSCGSEEPVSADGSFAVDEPGGGPALVMLLDQLDRVILLG